jgi:hypothetical protein
MEGEESLRRFSPEVMVQDPNIGNAVSLLPNMVLFHGTGDYSIPSDQRFEPLSKGFSNYVLTIENIDFYRFFDEFIMSLNSDEAQTALRLGV